MQDKQSTLQNDQVVLKTTQQNLTTSISTLETQQQDYSQKQDAYQSQKVSRTSFWNSLTSKSRLSANTEIRTRRSLTQLMQRLQRRQKLIKEAWGWKEKDNNHKADRNQKDESENGGETSTTKHTTTTQEENSGRLRMTYPVPSQTRITCGYHGYAGHTGVDFSCAANSKVVAAESGIVIISKDLTNSDGTYRSYGRYIVIMHDKTDSAGNYVYTLYAHNNSRLVSAGQKVKRDSK